MLRRLLGTFRKVLRGEKGYTLIEVASVVAITATLTAVALPIVLDKVNAGKEAAALQDAKQIGSAIATFFKDTGQFPAYKGATAKFYQVLRSGLQTGVLGAAGRDPVDAETKWGAFETDTLQNHLIKDDPGGAAADSGYLDASINWKGPYVESLNKTDPWGNNYLVYIKAFWFPSTGLNKTYGWIISAGPNAILETDETDTSLGGDDIGYYPFAAELGH